MELGEGVICTASVTSMSVQQQYTYLGLPMTTNLDSNVIVQDREEVKTNAHRAMRPSLT